MQYLGGKFLIAKQIAATILAATDERSTYIEPFVGAGSVAVQMVPHFEHSYLSDASPDLIMLWKALQLGWEPPEIVTEDYYHALKNAAPSAVRGFVGYGASFGGKWFGGYAKHSAKCCAHPEKTLSSHSRAGILRRVKHVAKADFYCLNYSDLLIPDNATVYLDPPYAGTTPYGRTGAFDSVKFWKWSESISARANVFVSEYSAPAGWYPIWTGTTRATLKREDNSSRTAEHLWVYDPAQSVPLALKEAA